MDRGIRVWLGLIAWLVVSTPSAAQVPEYDWYPQFRRWVQSSIPIGQRGPEAVAQRYREKLIGEGVAPAEIERRVSLLRTARQELENDFWNRFFTAEAPTFNTNPNAFLASVVEGRPPGSALDVGMGEGRNALFLARLGWSVTGVDPAEKALGLARERAGAMKLHVETVNALDTTFDFGRQRWDLIVYSWVPPTASALKAIESLRPGGLIVVEGARQWYPPNGLLKMFDGLRIVHYEDRLAASDFFNRSEMDVVRLVAEKPRP